VFFGTAGLSADLTVLADPTIALFTALLVLIASVGKFSGAFLGGKLAGMSWNQAIAVGSAMNARGSTEVIVASIGLSMGILTHNLFTMIVTMAILTTLAMPPMLRWALNRLPMKDEEKLRIDRETLDERGFIAKLERLLLAVDDSAIGKFTAYLAGLVGGGSGMPTTLVRFGASTSEAEDSDAPDIHPAEIKRGALASASAVQRHEDVQVEKMHLTMRLSDGSDKVLANEAGKGYDMLMVGLARSRSAKEGFSARLNMIARTFSGPLCLVTKAPGSTLPTLDETARILVPVNGTQVSRRAAEFALAIARPHHARVEILYVSRDVKRANGLPSISHRNEEAVLKDIADLATRYGVPVNTAIRKRGAPADAICREAGKGIAMVVMGVTQRAGDKLFFGNTAATVLARFKGPVVLLASERVGAPAPEPEAHGKELAHEA
jgi:nucleotide-binding universal stress UspA family protein